MDAAKATLTMNGISVFFVFLYHTFFTSIVLLYLVFFSLCVINFPLFFKQEFLIRYQPHTHTNTRSFTQLQTHIKSKKNLIMLINFNTPFRCTIKYSFVCVNALKENLCKSVVGRMTVSETKKN